MRPEVLAVLITISTFLGTILSNLVLKFFNNSIDSLFEQWRFKIADKRKCADEIIKICSQGATSHWTEEPRDYEHMLWVANNIQGFSYKTGLEIRIIAMLWSMRTDKTEIRKRTKKNLEDLTDTIHDLSIEALKQAWKWKNYKSVDPDKVAIRDK